MTDALLDVRQHHCKAGPEAGECCVISGHFRDGQYKREREGRGVRGDYRVPGEIKRREVELDPQVSPEEIMSREVELGCESWTSFASGCSSTAVQRTLSL